MCLRVLIPMKELGSIEEYSTPESGQQLTSFATLCYCLLLLGQRLPASKSDAWRPLNQY
jgi:hypothetical protein